jgi:RNA polymerase sigma factor (sigma-70 family)
MNNDAALLRRYLDEHSQEAFSELVQRHLGLVYHAAMRQCGGNSRQAEEIAQAVFSDLARKASSLAHHPTLAGWLHIGTRRACAHYWRAELRRRRREQIAVSMTEDIDPSSATDWSRLQPVIDDALAALSEQDRNAVLLRFIENRPFAEIGARLSSTEDAARMRVTRALDKLRQLLTQRGVISTSAALAGCLTTQAGTAVPAGLAVKITASALAMPATAGLGVVSFMTLGKTVTGLAFLLLGAVLLHQTSENRKLHRSLDAARSEHNDLNLKVRNLEARLASTDTLRRAAEDDGSQLLAAFDHASTNAGEPRRLITQDYVQSRYELAQELAKKGRHPEALKEFLWCFDEGMPPISGYGGVRASYLLSMIAKLGETYPPALAALRERRDHMEQRLQASANDWDAASDFASLNHYLKDNARNLQLYDQLPVDDPRRRAFSYHVYDQLRTARRYADALEASPYKKMVSDLDDYLEGPPASVPNAAVIRQKRKVEAVKETAKDIEVLAGTGNLDNARTLITRILTFDDSAETRAILQTHLTRAGHPQLMNNLTPTGN